MTHPAILNIGLLDQRGAEIAAPAVYKAMRAAGVLWERHSLYLSASEPTMVVECYCTDAQADLVATWLDQDCIAVWDRMHREGRLVGPRAAEWGEFDPCQFILLNGCPMSEARSAA